MAGFFVDIFADAHTDIFNALLDCGGAQTAQYRGASVSVIVDHDLTRWGGLFEIVHGSVLLSVQRYEVPERPRRDDVFKMPGGVNYAVESTVISDDYLHRCLALEVEP